MKWHTWKLGLQKKALYDSHILLNPKLRNYMLQHSFYQPSLTVENFLYFQTNLYFISSNQPHNTDGYSYITAVLMRGISISPASSCHKRKQAAADDWDETPFNTLHCSPQTWMLKICYVPPLHFHSRYLCCCSTSTLCGHALGLGADGSLRLGPL